jgi:PhnB protein
MNLSTPARGNPKLTTMLNVRDGVQAISFYQVAFGAKLVFSFTEGSVIAQMMIGEAEFWLADESPEHQNFSPESLGGSTVRMILVIDNPDEVFDRAVAAGAKVVWPVADQHYRWRIGRLVDPFGHHWEIGKPL